MVDHGRSPWRRWCTVVMLGLAALLAGCGRTLIQATPTPPSSQGLPTAAPTYTLAPAASASWHPGKLAALASNFPGEPSVVVSQLDSSLAWQCVPDGNRAHIWTSHDHAVTWSQSADVPVGSMVDSCAIVLDSLNPSTAVVMTYHEQNNEGCMACANGVYLKFLTTDSGASWSPVHGPGDLIDELATYHGKMYATFRPHVADLMPFVASFVVSDDNLQTWRPMDRTLAVKASDDIDSRYVSRFWINPATGTMLVQTQSSLIWSGEFDSSGDGGSTWRNLHAPAADDYLVRTPVAAGPWEICGLREISSNTLPNWSNTVPCTMDGGATWQTRAFTPPNVVFAIANDGSLLEISGTITLMRLPPGKSTWESLGTLPIAGLSASANYSAGSGKGAIWCVNPWGMDPTTTGAGVIYTRSYA